MTGGRRGDRLFQAVRDATPPHDVEAGRSRFLADAHARAHEARRPAPRRAWRWALVAAAAIVVFAAIDFGMRRSVGPIASDRATTPVRPAEDAVRVETPPVAPASAASPVVPSPIETARPHEHPTSAAAPPASAAPIASSQTTPSWTTFEERGDYDGAYAAASSAGIASLVRASSADELLRLAQVSRVSGHRASERDALLACRLRFPGTEASAIAAYELGRAAPPADAATWFETYMKEQPSGPLAREALGRLVEAYGAAGAKGPARDAARRYLARFEAGPHASLAKRVLAEGAE